MSTKANLCVILPVHKPTPTADEKASLRACEKQLNKYNCFLVYPKGMDTSAYTIIHDGLKLNPVNPTWLSSVEQYNKMKLSVDFYQLFAEYTYMLTYELDAYIFSPDIENTNALSFDFIGAPFFEGYWEAKAGSQFMPGCNSGFSIRNIQSCIAVLQGMKKYKLHWRLYKNSLVHSSRLRRWLNKITHERYEVFVTGRFAFHFAGFHLNEDVVWSEVVPKLFPSFKVADSMSALRFSFEYNLDESLAINDGNLPLGCHAWYKHMDFWGKYIEG